MVNVLVNSCENSCNFFIQPTCEPAHGCFQRFFRWHQIMAVHSFETVSQNSIPNFFRNSGIQHIGFYSPSDILKDETAWDIPAFLQAVMSDFLRPFLCLIGLPLNVKTKSCLRALGSLSRTVLTWWLMGIFFSFRSFVISLGSLMNIFFRSIWDH